MNKLNEELEDEEWDLEADIRCLLDKKYAGYTNVEKINALFKIGINLSFKRFTPYRTIIWFVEAVQREVVKQIKERTKKAELI